jgi:hypothetical protein
MKKIFLFIFTVFTFYLSAQTIVGGSGNCMVNGNPNTVLNLQTINQKFNCASVIDTTTGDHWIYKVSLSQGSRWENRTQQVKDSLANRWAFGGNNVAANGTIGTNTAYDLSFKTNNTERMRITSNGFVSIGSHSPTQKLDVNGIGLFRNGKESPLSSTQLSFSYLGSSNYTHAIKTSHYSAAPSGNKIEFWLWNQAISIPSDTPSLRVMSITGANSGSVGINTALPTNKLHIVGTNPARFEGLQTGASTDQLVTVDSTGLFRQRAVSGVTNYSSYAAISSSTTYTATSPNITKTTGTITVTLPTASSAANKSFTFVKSDISTVLTIQANGSETINNANFITSNSQWDRITLFSTDTEWLVIGQ